MLIIGAGAHVPYGFPTSNELTEKIKDLVTIADPLEELESEISSFRAESPGYEATIDKWNICRLVKELVMQNQVGICELHYFDKMVINKLDEFVQNFAEAQVDSIDAFLAQRSNANGDSTEIEIGKLIIAYFINKYEHETPIGFHQKDWLRYLTNEFLRHQSLRDTFFHKPPKIYTFNYDNFLEKSLFAHLKAFHQMDESAARNLVQSLNISHIYGDTNSFNFVLNDSNHLEFYREAIKRIKVIGEERNSSANKITHEVIKGIACAKKVYFLGFGFDEYNSMLLFGSNNDELSQYFADTEFYSTHVNMTEKEKIDIQNRAPFPLIFPAGDECDCMKLVREEFPIFKEEYSSAEILVNKSQYSGEYDEIYD